MMQPIAHFLQQPIQRIKQPQHEISLARVTDELECLAEEPTVGMFFVNLNSLQTRARLQEIKGSISQIRPHLQIIGQTMDNIRETQQFKLANALTNKTLQHIKNTQVVMQQYLQKRREQGTQREEFSHTYINSFYTYPTQNETVESKNKKEPQIDKITPPENEDEDTIRNSIVQARLEPPKIKADKIPSFIPTKVRVISKSQTELNSSIPDVSPQVHSSQQLHPTQNNAPESSDKI
ncbi:MAG: hypothetical protein EZS28_021829 [Streblomastix strix]|uniref:Uncharacterized protein n=1 Tax=Streblomastix strix TaxID=222440 RepID=A0A5J4VJN6_9EUKA|nr:MAG: hypothetical protein EZS28_021829 [Streblomastix strix]